MSASAAGFLRALEYASEEVSADMTLNALRTFIFIALRGECGQKDVEVYLKVANATASRNVSYWTNRRFDRSPGPDLINRIEDDFDRRVRVLSLTNKGKLFYEKLREKM